MTQYMSTEILGKVAPEKISDIQSIAPNAEIGYILEVDLEVPVHLHDFFADYPLAPEKQMVPEDWLSLYNERLVYDKEVGEADYEKELEEEEFRKFQDVNLRVREVGDGGLWKIAQSCHKLEYLNISYCTEILEPSICNIIRSCPKLQHLSLRFCEISDMTIKEIA
ncbi:8733_t:CDS:2, partial [Funneliformis geosporum]